MLVKFVILACALVACLGAGTPAAAPQRGSNPPSPAATPEGSNPPSPAVQAPLVPQQPGILCGEAPAKVFPCLDNPNIVSKKVIKKCTRSLSDCDSMKCIFRELGWSTKSAIADDKVNKQNVIEYFDIFVINHPEWSAAVQHLKLACLDKDLPAQGALQNCAAFDVMHCIQTSFIKNALPSQWRNTTDCEYPRAYASACPYCPTSCFAPQVPIGTCNACLTLPRTP